MKPYAYTLISLLCCACGDATNEGRTGHAEPDTVLQTTATYAAAAPFPSLPACYQSGAGNQAVTLRLHRMLPSGEIIGDLTYPAVGKEQSSGSFFGQMAGDTLLANYSFIKKGKRTVREIAFLRQGDVWVEGSGPATIGGNTSHFADYGKISFSGARYQQVACP